MQPQANAANNEMDFEDNSTGSFSNMFFR